MFSLTFVFGSCSSNYFVQNVLVSNSQNNLKSQICTEEMNNLNLDDKILRIPCKADEKIYGVRP